MGNLATIIIDMQNHFVNKIPESRRLTLINSQLDFIDYSINNNIPILTVEYYGVGSILNYVGIGRSTICEITDKLKNYKLDFPNNISFFSKSHASAFTINSAKSEDIRKKLFVLGVNELFIMGLNSDACVYETVVDASENYVVHVADDVMTSPDNFIKHYPSLEDRKNRFREPSEDEKGGLVCGNQNNIFYHDSHNDFINYFENRMAKKNIENKKTLNKFEVSFR